MASSLRSPRWRPPGQPPAVAVARHSGRAVVLGCVGVAGYLLLVLLLEGLRLRDLLGLPGLLVGGPVVLLTVHSARTEVLAGPGWLAVRGLGRRRWVRTDRLVEADTWSGRYGGVSGVELHDADGRSVSIALADLELSPRVQARVAEDVARSDETVALDRTAVLHLVDMAPRPRRRRRRRR